MASSSSSSDISALPIGCKNLQQTVRDAYSIGIDAARTVTGYTAKAVALPFKLAEQDVGRPIRNLGDALLNQRQYTVSGAACKLATLVRRDDAAVASRMQKHADQSISAISGDAASAKKSIGAAMA